MNVVTTRRTSPPWMSAVQGAPRPQVAGVNAGALPSHTGADPVGRAGPVRLTMLGDGGKGKEAGDTIKTRAIAELLADRLE